MNRRYGKRTVATWALAAALLLALGPVGVQAQDGEWERQNPLPLGSHLYGVWGSSGSDVFAVGYGGAMLRYSRVPTMVVSVYLPVVLKHPPYPGWPP